MMRDVDGRLKAVAAALAVVAWMVLGVSSAFAAGAPQWRITAGSEPTSPTTHVVNEVQEVTVEGASGGWELKEISEPGRPVVAAVGPFFTNASAAEVQEKLDEKLGAGTTLVTGGQAEGKPYRIEFIGELSGAEVTIKGTEAFGLTASLREVSAGSGLASLMVTAVNVGAGTTTGTTTVVAHVPAGFAANSTVTGEELLAHAVPPGNATVYAPASCELAAGVATCTLDKAMIPGDGLRITITGHAEAGVKQILTEASVSGGGAAEATVTHASATDATPSFGIEPGSLVFSASEAGAGGHPNLTTGFAVSTLGHGDPAGFTRSIDMKLPAGVIGDPQVAGKCTMQQVNTRTCPSEDAVGVASARVATPQGGLITFTAPVYDVVPNAGEPAAFAFNIGFPVRLEASVGPEGEYHVKIKVENVTQALKLISSTVTLWGVPDEYNGSRTEEVEGSTVQGPYWTGQEAFGVQGDSTPAPFIDYPTQCGEALTGAIGLVSWPEDSEGVQVSTTSATDPLTLPTATGCGALPFAPEMKVQSSNATAARPAGYAVHLDVPQNDSVSEPATAEVRNVEVAMPEGTVISPSAANGLTDCTEAQFGKASGGEGHCPTNSDIGEVEIVSPLLSAPLKGNVYVGEQQCGGVCTPQQAAEGKLVRLLLEAYGSGVRLKLAGRTEIDQATGRLTTVFADNPQLPFSELSLSLKNGEDAPLVNPSTCGNVVATANITPWSSAKATHITAPAIAIGGCSATGFAPTLKAGMTATRRGGSFSPLVMTLTRPEGQQTLSTLSMHMPPGMEAILNGVPRCTEAQANSATCPADTQIGTTTAVVGPGSEPYAIEGGKVYLTGPYAGAPFGLAIVTPAKAGPYTLAGNAGNGNEVVRASIHIDPTTAAITIDAGLPTALDGIPLSIDEVIVDVNRANFMFNPTDCNAMSITATVDSTSGAAANVATPFQADNCAALPFHPTLTAETHAHHTRRTGAYLKVAIAAGADEANLAKVKVTLPAKLPAQLNTLKGACLEAQFKANPAACPAGATVGHVVVHTPVLSKPLEGPAIFVSHGGLKFPDLAFVLQGEGVTIIQEGITNIRKDVTSSSFNAIPDVPVSSIEVILPQGGKAALGGNTGNMCYRTVTRRKRVLVRRHGHLLRRHGHLVHRTVKVRHRKRRALIMPTTITGQNGAVIHQKTRLAVRGCGKAHSTRHHAKHHHKHHHHNKRHHNSRRHKKK